MKTVFLSKLFKFVFTCNLSVVLHIKTNYIFRIYSQSITFLAERKWNTVNSWLSIEVGGSRIADN